MAIETVLKLLETFKEPLIKLSQDLKDEFLQAFTHGIPEYLENYYDKYSKTKTFIYREEKVDFYDIFYPVTLKTQGKRINEITDLKKLFFKRNFITIIGTAGSGKSMLMKHIFLSTVNQSYKIPIVIELRNLNEYSGTLTDYISESLLKNKLAKSKKLIDSILSNGNFLFLFDGYDEIFSTSKRKMTTEIEDFVDSYSKNIFVITSRPGANCESLERFDNFYVEPLNENQIKEFIELQYKNHDNENSIEKIISVIQNSQNKDYKDYLSSPLLLSMFIFTFNNYPELPRSKNKFYWNVFDTLCTKHDTFTKKGSWLHERKSGLLNEDFENVLKWLSYITIFKGKYNFDENYLKKILNNINNKLQLAINTDDLVYDLNVSISILILDGTDYTFPHKSLQEYFCAYLIKDLTEQQKEIIYTEKFIYLNRNSTGGNLNFFKLCFELDKHHFIKYYLIPNAKKFLQKIDNSSNEKLVKSFMKEFEISFGFRLEKNEPRLVSAMYNQLASESYLSFFKQQRSIPNFNTINNETTLVPIKDLFGNEKIKSITLSGRWNKKIKLFVEYSGLTEHFTTILNEINSNIQRFENEITSEKISTSELLDI